MKEKYRFEVCANGVESCLAAQEGGADRVELCAGIPEGGTTPSYGEIKVARRVLTTTRLHVIIRPRGGDFLYTPLEVERMVEDIKICKALGVDGVVIGCLCADGTLDMEANRLLVEAAQDMSVTFHRAFDRCNDPRRALAQLIELGVDRVLTSGQQPTALEGVPLLKELNALAADRIIILAGCGVTETNIKHIADATGVCEFHFSARVPVKSRMEYMNPDVYMGAKDADGFTRAVIDLLLLRRCNYLILTSHSTYSVMARTIAGSGVPFYNMPSHGYSRVCSNKEANDTSI